MSDVLVKDIEMPKICAYCFLDTSECDLHLKVNIWRERHPDCPLVEIPTPHGRLIDADALIEKITLVMNEPDYQHDGENWMVGLIMARDAIDEQPTIQPEIVRCKDCKYWNSGSCECPEHAVNNQDYYVGDIETEAEHFCGYAERREVTT